MAITETWLGSDIDKGVLSELVPDTHAIYHVPRKDRKGGGVALILNKSFQLRFQRGYKNILDKHAPLQSKVVTIRPNTQWYSDELREIKHERRKAERIWRRTKLNVHEQIYKEICYKRNELLARSKVEFYSSKIKESESDAKQIYKLANTLIGSTKDQSLPSHHGDMTELANSFANFFSEKIHMIRCTLTEGNQHGTNPMLADVKFTGNALTEFSAVDSEDLRKNHFKLSF
ncbi:hypothetical protein FSP39_012275 [Pinctada imbricata]|uniref:Uncharacterized protein n=1 Tax=Pinctada imbricata TaxID=66713 RepID=A0AA89BYZ8_PINIB|nr:hypothetical protein FSP39_012275 [Pinctada imbricata]